MTVHLVLLKNSHTHMARDRISSSSSLQSLRDLSLKKKFVSSSWCVYRNSIEFETCVTSVHPLPFTADPGAYYCTRILCVATTKSTIMIAMRLESDGN